jgi:hypothetical protein
MRAEDTIEAAGKFAVTARRGLVARFVLLGLRGDDAI